MGNTNDKNTHCELFSLNKCSLGEGLIWDALNCSLFWLDITNKKLYRMKQGIESMWTLPESASVILEVEGNLLKMASESGLVSYCINSKRWAVIAQSPTKYLNTSYRANDGIQLDKNNFLYGVMKNAPTKKVGALVLARNGISKVVFEGIAIPNTFVVIPNTKDILISDSLEQKVYRFSFDKEWSKVIKRTLWLDLSETRSVPDGGCIGADGNVYIALWDGGKIMKLTSDGVFLAEYEVPVPRPTNCTFGELGTSLFVTTAKEGLSEEALLNHPNSGGTFKLKLTGRK